MNTQASETPSATTTPRRVFITGALGFLGRRIGEAFRASGAQVSGMDVRADPGLGVVAGDTRKPGAWQDAFAGADLVVHAAARLGMEDDEEGFWRINVLGTRNALDAAAGAGVPRFIHISSIVAYGFDFDGCVDERWPIRTNGVPYVDTKVAGEQVVLAAHAAGETACTVIRPGDVYGPGSHYWTVMPVRAIAARRLIVPAGFMSPVYVDDIVAGILIAGTDPRASGQVFTLTGERSVENRDFFGRYARMLGRRGVPSGPTRVVAALAAAAGRAGVNPDASRAAVMYLARRGSYSIEKARAILGYSPAVDLDEGMRRCEEWLRAEGLLPPRRPPAAPPLVGAAADGYPTV